MSSDWAVRVEGLSKRYRIGTRQAYGTFRETLTQLLALPFSPRARRNAAQDAQYIWSLKDVSFTIQQGQVMGIIGPNGAGKTTLLKILSRITPPTAGWAKVRGRVASLLEVGTGFHPELTGRENIYLNGAILNMTRAEIARKFDAIVDFAGVEPFIDTPVKRYSSGMYMRLAFSVAAHLDPEILLVDEVLAVGDVAFQEKCLGQMRSVAKGGRTVLFISHNMQAIRTLCSQAILLQEGRIQYLGTAAEAVHAYLSGLDVPKQADSIELSSRRDRLGHGAVRALGFWAHDGRGGALRTGAEAQFFIRYAASETHPLLRLHVALAVMDVDGAYVFGCSTGMTPLRNFHDAPAMGTVTCRIPQLPLIPGSYVVKVVLKDDRGLADMIERAATFTVTDGGDCGMTVTADRSWGSVIVPHAWSLGSSDVPLETAVVR